MCVVRVWYSCVALTGRTRKSPAGSLFIGPVSHWTHREDNYSLHRPGSIQRTASEIPLRMAIVDMGRPRAVPPREPTHGLCWVLGLGKQPHATLVQATFARGLFKQVCVAANATQWTDHTFSVESTRGCMHRRWVVQVTPRTKLQHRTHVSAMPNAVIHAHCIAKTREPCQCEIQARDIDSFSASLSCLPLLNDWKTHPFFGHHP